MPRSKTVWGQAVPAHLDLRSCCSSIQSWALRTPFVFSGSSSSVRLAHQTVCATTLIRISRLMGHLFFVPGKNQPLRQQSSKTSALSRPWSRLLNFASRATFCVLTSFTFIFNCVIITIFTRKRTHIIQNPIIERQEKESSGMLMATFMKVIGKMTRQMVMVSTFT